jgi:hypothetical protein
MEKKKLNLRAQSLPPGAVVSAVAFATSTGALGSIQLRKTYMEMSKTYLCSSSCLLRLFCGRKGLAKRVDKFSKRGADASGSTSQTLYFSLLTERTRSR